MVKASRLPKASDESKTPEDETVRFFAATCRCHRGNHVTAKVTYEQITTVSRILLATPTKAFRHHLYNNQLDHLTTCYRLARTLRGLHHMQPRKDHKQPLISNHL